MGGMGGGWGVKQARFKQAQDAVRSQAGQRERERDREGEEEDGGGETERERKREKAGAGRRAGRHLGPGALVQQGWVQVALAGGRREGGSEGVRGGGAAYGRARGVQTRMGLP